MKRTRLDMIITPCNKPTTNVISPFHGCKKGCPCTKALSLSGIDSRMNQARSEEEEKERPEGRWKKKVAQ